MVTIQFDAHCGTVAFWRSAMRAFGARSWKGAMRKFAHQHGNAIAMLANDDALIISADGTERHIPSAGVVWRGRP